MCKEKQKIGQGNSNHSFKNAIAEIVTKCRLRISFRYRMAFDEADFVSNLKNLNISSHNRNKLNFFNSKVN